MIILILQPKLEKPVTMTITTSHRSALFRGFHLCHANHGLARPLRAMAAGLRGAAALEHGDAADLEIRGAGHHLPLCGGGIFEAWTMLGV